MKRGHKIIIILILFLAAMLGVVYYASKESNKKEEDHSDDKEIRDQTLIESQNNLKDKSPGKLLSQDEDEVFVTLPSGTYSNTQQGNIEFMRYDGQGMDMLIPFILNKMNIIVTPKTSLGQGLYKIRVSWNYENKDYVREEDLLVK